ncbi:rhodanese-like domain-containing protein [Jiulongibacter sp. NS-SX5]|uniref:rhodanese-like domain-containing protein n=1 Tax=Jiulongibacter sp. NS-SX5 TaxID=3463854 RepID=UPI004059ECFB
MFGLLKKLFGEKVDYKELVANGAKIIDVRTPQEFNGGHAKGAVNIPLDTIDRNITKLKAYNKPLVMCCASGMRSGRATSILKSKGLTEVYNAGSWVSLR